MKHALHASVAGRGSRSGFTLVEMLVATALVLLIMLLFAQIYGAAVGTITEQRGMANNDGKARTVQAIISKDLNHLTYRQMLSPGTTGIVPLGPGDPVDPRQRGFIYISENVTADPTDDVFHYTVDLLAGDNPSRAYGRATNLGGTDNQPDADDGAANSLGSSRYAQVCLFLRGGNLYRRVLLLREPLGAPLGTVDYTAQPSNSADPLRPQYWTAGGTQNYGSGSFHEDFDYSATRVATDADSSTTATYLMFLGADSLDNSQGYINNPIAAPRNRFGFIQNQGRPEQAQGDYRLLLAQPVEFDSSGATFADRLFIGRFLQRETSDATFLYPGQAQTGLVSPGTLDSDYVLNGVSGSRTGEDLLLQNVSAFDIEVWDPGYEELDFDGSDGTPYDVPGWDPTNDDVNGNGVRDVGAWVNLGAILRDSNGAVITTSNGTGMIGAYNHAAKQAAWYGPDSSSNNTQNTNNIFDTWHPSIVDDSGNPLLPPFRTYRVIPQTVLPPSSRAWPKDSAVTSGARFVFPDYSDDGNSNNDNYAFIYRCVQSGTTGTKEPEWPRQHGALVRENVGTPDEVVWQCYDNRVGLEAVRITLRYTDPGSGLERQLTIYHSFVE